MENLAAKKKLLLSCSDIEVKYHLAAKRYSSLKEFLIAKISREYNPEEEFVAVTNVSFSVEQGECVGLLGHNGSGKSTLLKVIAGIISPVQGRVVMDGQLGSLIELGAGFDPELPAKDNIILTGMLMGFSRKYTLGKIDEIIAFAELEDFIDFPLKNYSSGMYARLGFACATIIQPDLVLIDEALAVGDEKFQKKCLLHLNHMRIVSGCGIILVTHDMHAIESFCSRVIVLYQGSKIYDGDVPGGIAKYRELLEAPRVNRLNKL